MQPPHSPSKIKLLATILFAKNLCCFSLDLANKQMNSGIYLPLLDIKSMYNLKGKILVLPLVGHGRCELKLSKVNTKVFTDLSYPIVQGRQIMKIDRMKVAFTVGELKVNLHNLFNGNKVLGKNESRWLAVILILIPTLLMLCRPNPEYISEPKRRGSHKRAERKYS